MLALSIRQPYAELILRGVKTAELRSKPTHIIGQRFYIYAAKAKARPPVWSRDLEIASPPGWMIELAEQVKLIRPGDLLPTGLLVGSAVIERVIAPKRPGDRFEWVLAEVERLQTPIKPGGHPQPVWWRVA